jgi:hypothetical protein
MKKFPFIGETPGLIDGKHFKKMGKARGLFDLLVQHQTGPDGSVNYGRPIGYSWMRKRIPNPPPERTLRRWMSVLRRGGYAATRRVPYGGMVVTVLKPKKWAQQLHLFPRAEVVEITHAKPVKKLLAVPGPLRPEVAVACGQKWPQKVFKKNRQ